MGRAKRRARPLWTLQRLCFEPDVAADPSDRGENRDPGTATEAIKMHLTVETQLENAPFQARKTSGSLLRVVGCCHLSGLRCGERPPLACMGVRGLGPDHPERACRTLETPGCPSPVSPTVAPYSPSARPHVLAIVVSLRRHGRSSIGAAFDEQGPDDAGHLVGQSNGD